MALGFGFNKAKVLASAEKFVQQGKLPSAIAEYEKIIKEDPKDLTVLNTIGDLYARSGENEKAAHYFKKVGDQYAQDGFSVKAIAIYKKLTKLSPNNYDNVHKLAELYGQQGLFNDARAQYMIVADHLLKSGDNTQGAKVLQRILELDPENTATQSKLADLYSKLGKKDEARNIYYTAAETLHARGSYDAAAEALGKVLKLDPENPQALLLRGMIAADSDDNLAAVQYLGQVPDLDSRPDGLRALLRAKLYAGNLEGVEGIANKLLTVHNDLSGVTTLAEWHVARNHVGSALKLYEQNADPLLAAGRAAFQEALYPLIPRIRDNTEALGTMLRLMQRASDTARCGEIMELQANAHAAKGEFRQARDIYQKLTEMEPENALHNQNYKQMLSKLGEDPATRHLSPQEAAQAFMVEELDEGAAVVHQTYDPPTEKALEAALTDAELFVSYNVPSKAIPPLEAVLHMAPRDVVLHQRLAVLYARADRHADAARMCQALSDIYRELGHDKDAVRYQEAARKYSLRAPAPPPVAAVTHAPVPPPAPVQAAPVAPQPVAEVHVEPPAAAAALAEQEAPSVQEFSFDVPDMLESQPEPSVSEQPVAASPEPVAMHLEPAMAVDTTKEKEEDHADEWEGMVSVEEEEKVSHAKEAATAAPRVPEMEVVASKAKGPEPAAAPAPPEVSAAEKIQEIQFYISQEMWDAAKKAILDLTEIAPNAHEITDFISAVSAGQARAARASAPKVEAPVENVPLHVERASKAPVVEPVPEMPVRIAPEPEPPAAETLPPSAPALVEFAIEVEEKPAPVAEPVAEAVAHQAVSLEPVAPPPPPPPPVLPARKKATPVEPVAETITHEAAPAEPAAPPPPPPILPTRKVAPVEPAHAVAAPAKPPVPARPAAAEPPPEKITAAPSKPAKPVAPPPTADALDDILAIAPDVAEPPPLPAPPAAKQKAAKVASTEQILSDFVVDLENTDLVDFVPHAKPEPVPPAKAMPAATAAPAPPAPAAPAAPTPQPAHTRPSVGTAPREARAAVNGDMQDAESASVLSDILAELQEETAEEPVAESDPETHYNLGIAFKEMGLLDEAIGELQKVCHSVDRGSDFSQPIQAYTWLAQCLVDKGAPEAAVRWYQKALQLPRLDDDSRCAIYYDLATAYEATGDKKLALANFMEVYGSNIDFRDVASRIKALKS